MIPRICGLGCWTVIYVQLWKWSLKQGLCVQSDMEEDHIPKVVRETSNSNSSLTEPIEIPPPRPKRKPSHLYPCKLVLHAKKENPMNHHTRSISSIYEQQNGSPTSVLPALASNTLPSEDLATPDVSPCPISPNEDVSQAEILPSDENAPKDDVQTPPLVPNNQISVKLEVFPGIESIEKPESVATTKVLRLFGKDVVVPSEPFDSSKCFSKSPSSDMEELLQASQPMDIAMQTAEVQRLHGIVKHYTMLTELETRLRNLFLCHGGFSSGVLQFPHFNASLKPPKRKKVKGRVLVRVQVANRSMV